MQHQLYIEIRRSGALRATKILTTHGTSNVATILRFMVRMTTISFISFHFFSSKFSSARLVKEGRPSRTREIAKRGAKLKSKCELKSGERILTTYLNLIQIPMTLRFAR
jgi:hypothetical protein